VKLGVARLGRFVAALSPIVMRRIQLVPLLWEEGVVFLILCVSKVADPGAMNSSLVVVITKMFTVTASSTTMTSTSVSTLTSTPKNSACPLDAQSCAASLGGGCCPTNRVCALDSCAPLPATSTTTVSNMLPTTTATGVEPFRPNSGLSTDITTPSNPGPTTCPTGFYACEAYYEGGCCRTGRDCQKTSCPPTSSTTIINSGVTIVVPVGSAAVVATPTGN
ncbi:hypothetical protein BUE80_DR007280, partial [Diplocarpon rosae]